MRHVVDSPWWLLWLFARPKTRAMARWNRLEQAEVTAQTASLNLRPPASCDSFVRAAAQRVSLPTGVSDKKGQILATEVRRSGLTRLGKRTQACALYWRWETSAGTLEPGG